jgi:uncharacterized protein (TIGR02996 family)
VDTPTSLMAGLAAEPGDPLAWQALADWLEESGEPQRAELARLNLRLRLERGHRQHRNWQKRVQELLAAGVRPCVPELVNSIGMRFVLVPPGDFLMGSRRGEEHRTQDEVRHEVQITRGFWLGVFPVTQAEYRRVMRRNPSSFRPDGEGGDEVAGLSTARFPVECVSWFDAVEFCAKLSRSRRERQAGRSYRLPTDAEWEYACRAGTTTVYHVGSALRPDQANCGGFGGHRRPCPVGSYPPNAWGLFDMHGQVWEWCSDWIDSGGKYYRGAARDPQGPAEGEQRILRGGSWNDGPDWCRAGYRNAAGPDHGDFEGGFRVVCVTGAPA